MSLPFHHSVLRALSLRSRHCEVQKKLTPADVRGRGARSQYCLSLKVPFPGLGNDVKVQLPVIVSSGIDAPVVRGTAVSAPVRGSASGWRSESDAGLGPAESQGGHARLPTATLDLPP